MKKLVLYIAVFILLLNHCLGQSADLISRKVEAWQNSKLLSNSSVGIAVYDMQQGNPIIKPEPQLSLAPASILKVVTTATALEVFGPDYQFKTQFSYAGTIKNDTLWGDLQIIGGGDPTLGSAYFPEAKNFTDEWVKSLKNARVKVITGKLLVDASVYEKVRVPVSWIWEDLGNYYAAGASGISVFDNLFEIHLKSPDLAGQPVQILKITPEIPGLEIKSEVLSSEINSDQAYVFGNPEDSNRVIRGTIPKGKSDFIVKASIPDPSVVLANELRSTLNREGIRIQGETFYEKVEEKGVLLKETISPRLNEIIKVTNYESVNLFAEHLLKHLAWQKNGIGTTKEGCRFVTDFWKDKGMPTTGFFMNDGSGLSRFDAITAEQMCWILNYMKLKSAYSDVFVQSLPGAGYGTLTAFNPEIFPGNCLRAKSGSMTRVRCCAGYLKTAGGKNLSFAIMLNNFSCTMKEATQKIEELLIQLRKL